MEESVRRDQPGAEGAAADRRRLLVAAFRAGDRAAPDRGVGRAGGRPRRDVGRARPVGEHTLPTALAATWDEARSSGSAGCWPSSPGARASTCCSPRPSTCTGRPTAAGTSSASARTRCSPRGSARPTCAGCRPRACGDGQALRRQRLRDRAVHPGRPGRRADTARALHAAVRADPGRGPWAVMAAYNRSTGTTMTEPPMLEPRCATSGASTGS